MNTNLKRIYKTKLEILDTCNIRSKVKVSLLFYCLYRFYIVLYICLYFSIVSIVYIEI